MTSVITTETMFITSLSCQSTQAERRKGQREVGRLQTVGQTGQKMTNVEHRKTNEEEEMRRFRGEKKRCEEEMEMRKG